MKESIDIKLRYLRRIIFYFLYRYYQIFRMFQIRRKHSIRVLFVIADIGMWKTENLYKMMLEHDRFEPLLLPLSNCRNPQAEINVITYFKSKGYRYDQIISSEETVQSKIHPDIIFYQQPYDNFIDKKYFMMANLKSIICHVNYCFRNICDRKIADSPWLNIPFQQYMENEVCAREFAALMTTKGRNIIVTGLPVMDELMQDKGNG